jgi:hypothetical protein
MVIFPLQYMRLYYLIFCFPVFAELLSVVKIYEETEISLFGVENNAK